MNTTLSARPTVTTRSESPARSVRLGLLGGIGGLVFAGSVIAQNAMRSKFPTNDARAADVKSISDDQERIRKNMMALDKASALYKRYVGELDSQETKIENLRQEATRLRGQAETAERELRAYVDGLGAIE